MQDTDRGSDGRFIDQRVEFFENESVGLVLTKGDLSRFASTTRRITYECSSGDRITGCWWGIILEGVLDELTLPDNTTHLLVEARDGHKTCLDIHSAYDALLAFERLDRNKPHDAGLPRLLRSGLEGPRSLKWVDRVRSLHLAPGDRPEAYEPLPPSLEDESGTST